MGAQERSEEQERFRGYVERFVTYLSSVRNLSENTVRAYRTDLDAYCDWVEREGVRPLEVTHRQLRRFLGELSRARYATKTINRHLSAVRALYRWLVHEGLTDKDSAAAVASPKLARTLPKTMSDADASALMETCDTGDIVGIRDRAFLEMLYASGARISEVSGLDVRDVDLASAQARLFGKGSKERIVPLYDACLQWLGTYLREARPQLAARAKGTPTQALLRKMTNYVIMSRRYRTKVRCRSVAEGRIIRGISFCHVSFHIPSLLGAAVRSDSRPESQSRAARASERPLLFVRRDRSGACASLLRRMELALRAGAFP